MPSIPTAASERRNPPAPGTSKVRALIWLSPRALAKFRLMTDWRIISGTASAATGPQVTETAWGRGRSPPEAGASGPPDTTAREGTTAPPRPRRRARGRRGLGWAEGEKEGGLWRGGGGGGPRRCWGWAAGGMSC